MTRRGKRNHLRGYGHDGAVELVSSGRENRGRVAANYNAMELWRGEINGKKFEVLLEASSSPKWSGEELDEFEQAEIMNELAERSSL